MDTRTFPTAANESEYGCPKRSDYGQSVKASILSLVNDAQYLPGPFQFRRFFGNAINKPGKVIPITHRFGYAGDVSLKYQPEIQKRPGFAR